MNAKVWNRAVTQSANKPAAGAGTNGFETIFLANWTRVYRLLVRLVGDPFEAEDLALETFYRLHASQQVANPPAWLSRVATNLGLDAIRRWKRRQHYELDAGRDVLNAQEDNPADMLARKEEERLVRQMLSELEPRMAQLLILRYSGMSYREIAATIGVSPTSIGPLLLRAEKAFRQRCQAAGLKETL